MISPAATSIKRPDEFSRMDEEIAQQKIDEGPSYLEVVSVGDAEAQG